MAAVFYSPSPDKSIFKGDFAISTAIKIPFLNTLIGSASMAIITEVSVENSENIQYFLTFDDVISYFYFGSGLGNITVRGMFFMNCDGSMPGLEKYYQVIGANRGKPVEISAGSATFQAVINNFSVVSSAEPTMSIDFQISMSIIKSTLTPVQFTNKCG